MKALVTGGAGFIGSNLAAELVRLGFEVTTVLFRELGCGECTICFEDDNEDAAMIFTRKTPTDSSERSEPPEPSESADPPESPEPTDSSEPVEDSQ